MCANRTTPLSPSANGSHDGTPHCLLCSHDVDARGGWCELADAMLCPECCGRVTDLQPDAVVGALEHRVDVAVTPDEVEAICQGCESRGAREQAVRYGVDGVLPS